jgi:putative intracellular protease/amidase
MTRALFLILPGVELLDLAGPLQALHEAGQFGAAYEPRFCSPAPEALTDQGPLLARLEPLIDPAAGDLVFIPGSPAFGTAKIISPQAKVSVLKWPQMDWLYHVFSNSRPAVL